MRLARKVSLRYLIWFFVVAGTYVATGRFGLSLASATDSITAVWAPTGISLAALLLGGYRLWPAVSLGALLTNVDTGVPAYVVLAITVGNTLEALVGAFLLRRVADFSARLGRLRDVLALLGFAALTSTAVAATIGSLALLAAGELGDVSFGRAWLTWWLGDMGGNVVVAPLILVAACHWPYTLVRRRLAEAVLIAAAVAALAVLVFEHASPLTYATFPPLIWAALRLRQVGATFGTLILATIAFAYSDAGTGPFGDHSIADRLMLAQTFVLVGGALALILAGVTSERRTAEDRAIGIATTLQASLLPRTLPTLPGVDSATFFRAAGHGHRVGGDFYDVFELPQDRWGLVIGDVRGKGAKAAAITALVRYTLRNAALVEGRPSHLLGLVHAAMLREYGGDEFCTAVCASFELARAGGTVTLSNGGHPSPLVISPDAQVAPVGQTGMLLGTPYQPELRDDRCDVRPGESLVFYTDGLLDAYAPERLVAEEDLAAVMSTAARQAPDELIAAIHDGLLSNGSDEPRDDIAIVALRITGTRLGWTRGIGSAA